MTLFTTPPEVAVWMGTSPPDNVDLLIRKASGLVANAIKASVYRTTVEGLPTDPILAKATSDATCIQVEAWVQAGIENPGPALVAAQTQRVQSKSLGGASVTYADAPGQTAAWLDLASGGRLAAEALNVLDSAGLLQNNIQAEGYRVHRPYDYIGGVTIPSPGP